MPTRERAARTRTKERLAEIADEVRNGIRQANMGGLNDDPWPCDRCGLHMAPIITWGYGHWSEIWFCPLCDPEDVAKALAKTIERARREVVG